MQTTRCPPPSITLVLVVCACQIVSNAFASRLHRNLAALLPRRHLRSVTHRSSLTIVGVPGFAVVRDMAYEAGTFYVESLPDDAAHVERQLAQTINSEPSAPIAVRASSNTTSPSNFMPGTTWLFYDTQGQFMAHYYHFLEYVLGLWAVDSLNTGTLARHSSLQVSNVLMGPTLLRSKWKNQGQHDLNALLLTTLFPDVAVWDADNPLPSTKRLVFERVVIADRLGAHRDSRATYANKMDYGVLNWALEQDSSVFEPLKHRFVQAHCPECFKAVAAPDPIVVKSTGGDDVNTTIIKPRLTYISRQRDGRRLDSRVAEALETMLVTDLTPFYNVDIVYMQDLSAVDQIRRAAASNVMLSVHGNGLSHAMWMPRGGAVVEMFPNQRCLRDYLMLATVAGHSWVGIDNGTIVVPGQGTFCQDVPTGNDDDAIVVDVDVVRKVLLTLRQTVGKFVLV